MAFIVFLLLNALLFIRPEELFPELTGLRLYQTVILICLATSLPDVLRQLELRALASRPITICVVGLLPAIILSHVWHLRFDMAWAPAYDFAKIVVYYLLFIAIVNTPN